MNTNLTEIAFVLDRSGSMQSMVEPAIAGFNRFLREQQAAPGEARLTLVLFDDEYLVPVDAQPIATVAALTTATYVPRAMTALLDAIGRTIDALGERLAALPEPVRPAKVIVTILTDGLENASTRYSADRLAAMIAHQTEIYGWEFLFLGANQDAIAAAARLGIGGENAATYQHSAGGYAAAMGVLSGRVLRRRSPVASMEPAPSLQEEYKRRYKESGDPPQ